MNRRLLLTSIATLATSRVLAQKNTPVPNNAPQAAPSVARRAPPTVTPPPAPSGPDARQKHIKDTMAVGSLSLMLSRIAQTKANHPRLKQFVEFEIAEQETVADVLKALRPRPGQPVRSRPNRRELMQNLDEEGKAAVAKLRSLRAGPSSIAHIFNTKSKGTGSPSIIRKSISSRPTISMKPISRNSQEA